MQTIPVIAFFFPFQDSDIYIYFIFPSSYFVFQPSIPGRVAQKHQQTANLTAGMLDGIIPRCELSGLQLNSDYDWILHLLHRDGGNGHDPPSASQQEAEL